MCPHKDTHPGWREGCRALPLPQALPVGPCGQVIGHKLCDFPVPLPFASQGWDDFQKMNGCQVLHRSHVLVTRQPT